MKENLSGKVFGRLTVLALKEGVKSKHGCRLWLCKCSCGNESTVNEGYLKCGDTKSCGCLKRETRKTHGMTGTTEHRAWQNMKGRCSNPRHPLYKHYGLRGIKVCLRWERSFSNFFSDMGRKPHPDYTLERIDNDAGYRSGNCKWATYSDQLNNTRWNHFLKINGQRRSVAAWARISGIARSTIDNRLYCGWTAQSAVFVPALQRGMHAPFQIKHLKSLTVREIKKEE